MSALTSRLRALEGRERRAHPPSLRHFTSVVRVPSDIPDDAWGEWLHTQPCACGTIGCALRSIGTLLPTPCQTEEAWQARCLVVYPNGGPRHGAL
jgi:hypothetical protein